MHNSAGYAFQPLELSSIHASNHPKRGHVIPNLYHNKTLDSLCNNVHLPHLSPHSLSLSFSFLFQCHKLGAFFWSVSSSAAVTLAINRTELTWCRACRLVLMSLLAIWDMTRSTADLASADVWRSLSDGDGGRILYTQTDTTKMRIIQHRLFHIHFISMHLMIKIFQCGPQNSHIEIQFNFQIFGTSNNLFRA